MTRVIYGVSGEGSGHSSRSREMATHLIESGHEVKIVSYDRGYRNLKDDFDVFETEGLRIASSDNRVSVVKTFTENISRLPEGYTKLQELRQLYRDFEPECVITDFEPMTAYLANYHSIPLISLDNQHRMRYMEYECPAELQTERRITKSIIRAMVPRPDVSLVITFYEGATTNDRTFLFPPILRRSVLDLSPTNEGHVLVYLTSGFESLLDVLKKFKREKFLVYGCDKTEVDGPLHFQPFSKDRFLQDLASAKAVIATAGFTLISESLYLKKSYLALPMKGQFEQQLNALMLDKLGYGQNMTKITEHGIGYFFYSLAEYEERLASYSTDGNDAIKAHLAKLVDMGTEIPRR